MINGVRTVPPLHEAISSRLAARSDVLGLVFLGSAAGVARRPDAWSDHDFFVFVEDDAAERYRTELSWLPPRILADRVRESIAAARGARR